MSFKEFFIGLWVAIIAFVSVILAIDYFSHDVGDVVELPGVYLVKEVSELPISGLYLLEVEDTSGRYRQVLSGEFISPGEKISCQALYLPSLSRVPKKPHLKILVTGAEKNYSH